VSAYREDNDDNEKDIFNNYTVQYCTILYYTILYYTTLYYSGMIECSSINGCAHWDVLDMYSNSSRYTVAQYSIVQYSTVQLIDSVMQYSTVQYRMLLACVDEFTVLYSTLLYCG
jgi:hypothetical protein